MAAFVDANFRALSTSAEPSESRTARVPETKATAEPAFCTHCPAPVETKVIQEFRLPVTRAYLLSSAA